MSIGTRLRQCPRCRSRVTVAEASLGLGIRCPECREIFVPEPDRVGKPGANRSPSAPGTPVQSTVDDKWVSVAQEASDFDDDFVVTDSYAPDQPQSTSICRLLMRLASALSLRTEAGRIEAQNLGVWDRELGG
jgi:hypothetical protein